MKVLHYSNRKCDGMYWDASTPEKEAAAIRKLFEYLKDYWEVYNSLEPDLASAEKRLKNARDKLAALTGTTDYSTKILDLEAITNDIDYYKRDIQDTNYQLLLFKEACSGSVKSICQLLRLRKGYEYETWEFIDVLDPLTP